MTRRISYVMIIGAVLALFQPAAAIDIPHQWTSLDGPYWANGIDVAYGVDGLGQDWHRYLFGTDENNERMFYWGDGNDRWSRTITSLPPINKLISYKSTGSGHIAICSAYGDDIRLTDDGGVSWRRLFFPEQFNRHFSSVEVPNSSQGVGNVFMVGTEAQQGLTSTYYSHIVGTQLVWDPIGQSSSEGLHVYDIESFPEPVFPPNMAIGTTNGIYVKVYESWDDSWGDPVAFGGSDVPVLESIDGWDEGKQIAAVNQSGARSLHLTKQFWTSFNYELRPGGQVFDKEVRDLAAIYWGGDEGPISCYAATSEGIFLIDIDAEPTTPVCTAYNLENTPHGAYPVLHYDNDFKSLDYYFKRGSSSVDDSAFIIATTPYNVYQIIETRDYGNNDITGIKVSEIVTGTFISDIAVNNNAEN
jgi:hypothetical protein